MQLTRLFDAKYDVVSLAQGAPHQAPLSDIHHDVIIDRLSDGFQVVEKILDIGDSAGASVGVFLDGKAVFKDNLGYQDVELGK